MSGNKEKILQYPEALFCVHLKVHLASRLYPQMDYGAVSLYKFLNLGASGAVSSVL